MRPLVAIGLLLVACSQVAPSLDLDPQATAWPEADRLFRGDPFWLGADGAYSVHLGGERTLWMFGDTFVATSNTARREESRMVRNSVAIQTGADPRSADISFAWGTANDGGPDAFFPGGEEEWQWPLHGVRIDDRLLLFLMTVEASDAGLGFKATGWSAVMVDNPDDPADSWSPTPISTPPGPAGVLVGSSALIAYGFLYAYAVDETEARHDVYVLRWPLAAAYEGDLSRPQWWNTTTGWRGEPSIVMAGAQTEFSVHYDAELGRYVQTQTEGFGSATLVQRFSNHIEGPWSAKRTLYRPAESNRAGVLVYAGKAHPHLTTPRGELAITYVANAANFGDLVSDTRIYFPRFVLAARHQSERVDQ